MVKILNGEIVADDDPRLRQPPPPPPSAAAPRQHQQVPPGAAGGPPPAGQGQAGGIGFSLSAPPFRTVEPLPGSQPLLNLPDVEVFGVRITPYAILCCAGLGIMLGTRGVLIALVLYYVYLANRNSQAAVGVNEQGPGAMDYLQRYLNGPQPRGRQAGPGGPSGGRGAGAGPAGQRAQPQGQAPPHDGREYYAAGGEDEGQAQGPRGAPAAGGGAGSGGGWQAFQGTGNKLGK
ncbi:hypothetical protein HYH03_006167 [Edaphochlamys debaryana]|uniref:Uncharacterized protein n=1 Tax=Edaphochlamys debaryana TaxID=47281 RepID=A0A836C161_9CHLO|nr:hypothetical protein HYH03_006167 [Edaphochlamys debaryana]|eukprot:KAG2495567.1 hypothetical protein HYH03_006167 [Edaphochlamys debaryana]